MAARPTNIEYDRTRVNFKETQDLVDELLVDPTRLLMCSHGGEPACAVYEVPRGCVALPGLQTQCLCPQHVLTDGSFEGMYPIVDMSTGAAWSRYRAEMPFYWMEENEAGVIVMRATVDYPLPVD